MAATSELGATFAIDDQWFVSGFVSKTFLKNTNTLSTGQTQAMTLDPLAYGVCVGYKF
jgi:outer membrane protein